MHEGGNPVTNRDTVMVEVHDLSFQYPKAPEAALKGVSLRVNRGEFVCITGPSGAGKTTLAMALCGAIPHLIEGACAGKVICSGLDLATASLAEVARRVGVVMQDPEAQLFSLTVYEDVAFGPENLRLDRAEIARRVEWSLRQVEMWDLRDRASSALSGGQKQRAAIACALAMGSELIILDEPTSELDPIGTEEVYRILKKLNDRGTTIVLVDQKVEELCPFVDRFIYLRQGAVEADMTPHDLFLWLRERVLTGEAVDVFVPQVTSLSYELYRRHQIDLQPVPITPEEFVQFARLHRAGRA